MSIRALLSGVIATMSLSFPAFAQTNSIFSQPFNVAVRKIQITPSATGNIFKESESITIGTSDGSSIKVMRRDGSVVHQGGALTRTYPVGHYFVECNGDRNQFVVLPNDYDGASFMGLETRGAGSTLYQPIIDRLNPRWLRFLSWPNQWPYVEPQRGNWQWADLDATINANAVNGRKILFTAWGRPAWQTNDAEFVSLYTEYVRRVVQRYRGKIHAIEVWNEANYRPTWPFANNLGACVSSGDVVRVYKQMLQSVHATVKSIAPEIEVVGAGWASPVTHDYIQELLTQGGAQWLDAMTFHAYERGMAPCDQDTDVQVEARNRVVWAIDKQMQIYRSLLGTGKKLYMNEGGLYGRSALGIPNTPGQYPSLLSGISWQRGFARAIKYVVLHRAEGVEMIVPHVTPTFTDDPNANYEVYGTEYGPRGPHPKTSAFAMTCYWLNNARFVGKRTLNNNTILSAWRRADGSGLVFLWALEGHAGSILANPPYPVTTIFREPFTGTTFSEEPLLVHLPATVADASMLDTVSAMVLQSQPLYTDLVPTQIGGPRFGGVGRTVAITNAVVNQGAAVGPFTIAVYLSRDNHINTTNDLRWFTRSISGLAQGATNLAITSVTVPNLPEESYYIALIVDPDNEIPEISESNNMLVDLSAQTKIWIYPNRPPVLDPISNRTAQVGRPVPVIAWAVDPDPEADVIRYFTGPLPTGASFYGRYFYWTPGLNQVGIHSVTFYATDGWGTNSQTITITVVHTETNRPPVQTHIGDRSVRVGQTLTFTTSASDPDGHPVSWYTNPLPTGAVFNASTRTFSWSPTTNQVGSHVVYITASDGNLIDTETVIITVLPPESDRPPVLNPIGNKSVLVGQTLTFTINGSDPDGDPLTYHAAPLPSGATFNTATRTFSWTPSITSTGSHAITFTVSDGTLSASETILIVVSRANSPPTITSPGNRTVNEGQTLTFTVSGSDPDGDALTYSASGLPAGATFDAGTRTFTWTPGFTQAGSYNVTFTVSDGSLSASTTITITVGNVNRAPSITSPGNRTVNEGQTLTFTVSGSDPDGDALTYSASGLPAGATFDAGTRTFTWTPGFTQAGSYNVTFTVSDGSLSASTTITITVGNVNRAPSITSPGNRTVNEGQTLTFTVSGSDPDGDALTYSASGLPAGATFDAGTRTFTWTPGFTQAGSYNVTFTVSDGSLSASTTITITAGNVNRAPVWSGPTNLTVEAGQLLTFGVSATDPDGDALTYAASDLPAGATFNRTTLSFSWPTSLAQTGTHVVGFTVSDGALSVSHTVAIIVAAPPPPNEPPQIEAPDAASGAATTEVTVKIWFTDPDNDPLSVSVAGLPSGATLTSDGRLRWVPAANQFGVYLPMIFASDGRHVTGRRFALFVMHPDYDWLAGSRFFGYRQVANKFFAYAFRCQDRTSLVIAWAASGQSLPLGETPGLQRMDFLGTPLNQNVLTSAPILFQSDPRISPRQALDLVVDAIEP